MIQETTGETLERLSRWSSLDGHDLKDIDSIPDASLVLSVLVQFQKVVSFEYQCINSHKMVKRELMCSFDRKTLIQYTHLE